MWIFMTACCYCMYLCICVLAAFAHRLLAGCRPTQHIQHGDRPPAFLQADKTYTTWRPPARFYLLQVNGLEKQESKGCLILQFYEDSDIFLLVNISEYECFFVVQSSYYFFLCARKRVDVRRR